MIHTLSIISPDTSFPPPSMSLSESAKSNIAFAAMRSHFSDPDNLQKVTVLVSGTVIEQEIGFAGTDISSALFTELVSQLTDAIYKKLNELSQ
jgi:hypothetical protein